MHIQKPKENNSVVARMAHQTVVLIVRVLLLSHINLVITRCLYFSFFLSFSVDIHPIEKRWGNNLNTHGTTKNERIKSGSIIIGKEY